MGGSGGMQLPGLGDIGAALVNPFAAAQIFGAKKAIDASGILKAPAIDSPAAPGPAPTPANSTAAMDDAANKQNQARGAAATIFGGGREDSSGLLNSGSYVSRRMLLGS